MDNNNGNIGFLDEIVEILKEHGFNLEIDESFKQLPKQPGKSTKKEAQEAKDENNPNQIDNSTSGPEESVAIMGSNLNQYFDEIDRYLQEENDDDSLSFDGLDIMSPKFAKQYVSQKHDDVDRNRTLTMREKQQIGAVYKGLSTVTVHVCGSEVDLVFRKPGSDEYIPQYCCVPVLLVSKRKHEDPKGELILAERGSGLLLMSMEMSSYTYEYVGYGAFIMFTYELIYPRGIVGLRFNSTNECRQCLRAFEIFKKILRAVEEMTFRSWKRFQKTRKFKKREISSPCQADHMTCLNISDRESFYSLKNFVKPETSAESAACVQEQGEEECAGASVKL